MTDSTSRDDSGGCGCGCLGPLLGGIVGYNVAGLLGAITGAWLISRLVSKRSK